MSKRVITVTHPDGTKKVLVSTKSNSEPVKSRPIDNNQNKEGNGRPKPFVLKAGVTKSKTPYKYGGKCKVI